MSTKPENSPSALTPNFDAIPEYVRRFPHWVVWRSEWIEERETWTKVPYDAKTLRRAASDKSETWSSFVEAQSAYSNSANSLSGIGFVFNPANDLFGVDFDRCLDEHGLCKPISDWIEKFNSYTELSVSATGLHIIARGVVGAGHRSSVHDLEIYDRLRYFCFTGRPWGDPRKLGWRQTEAEEFIKEFFPKPVEPSRPTPLDIGKSADELLRMAFNAKNGESIFRLFQGDASEYANDDSSADLALCSKLAFWSGGSSTLLDEMFRGSHLYREKWNKRHSSDGRTYGQMTIDKALSGCHEFYSGNGHRPGVQPKPQGAKLSPGIYTVNDVRERVFNLYESGGHEGGVNPGWNNLAELYTVKRGQFTVLSGIPGSGKSALLDAMLVNLSISEQWRFAICSIENQPIEQHLSQLIEIYSGEPFSQGPTPRMSRLTLQESLDELHKTFTFVLPPEEQRTLPGLLDLVSEIDVEGVVIDPWNELEHRRPGSMTETEYVSQALSKMRHHARLYNQHWWLVAHPTKLQKDKDGHYVVPTLYDISGSAHFRNKADMGLVCWRDFQDESAPTRVHVQKVRFRWCGKLGSCDLYFDKKTGRYSERPRIYSLPREQRA